MRLLKPSWLHHDGNPIFSIDIHPDDTRVVTGGQGNDSVGRVVIWNMQPILSAEKDANSNAPKLLCQLDHHNACVNCVRWSNSGKYLCSGGDDRVIIIWKLVSKYSGNLHTTSANQNSAFGKTNLEQWKTSSMLRSHTGDVLDIAWSPGDRYLASASVDNTVIVWDAQNFPQILTTLKEHNSLVKGVTWDPVGKYLASQSDDKTLKIWRVSDWELEQSVQDPFMECGGTTHVLRLDWSPDGLYLVSAHAMNGGGPTAQIVERTEWKTDKDFVGHRKAVVCVKFNGNIMQSEHSRIKHCCVALGSRDRSVSIWSTALKRPLVVIKDLFKNSVMDVSWSSCGTVMMACSWDGSVAVARFSWKEIGIPLSPEEKSNFFHKLYGKSAVSENCDIIQNLEVFLAKANSSASTAKESFREKGDKVEVIPQPERVVKGPTDKQIETRTADGRRRITPKFLLPPTDGEPAPQPKSEQAIFMQVKGKDIPNNQSTVDWRKSMVSSIENVKGFNEASNKAGDLTGKYQEEKASPPSKGIVINNNNGDIVNDNGELMSANNVEPMEVDLPKEANNNPAKLVNGNGLHAPVSSEDDKKTEAASGGATLKEKMVNGECSGVPSKENETEEVGGAATTKGNDLMNGSFSEKPNEPKGKNPSSSLTKSLDEGNSSVKKPEATTSDTPVNIIPFRKKKLLPEDNNYKAAKKSKIGTAGEPRPGVVTTPQPAIQKMKDAHPGHGSSLVTPPVGQRLSNASTSGGISAGKSDSPRNRLPPMKIDNPVLNIQVDLRSDCSYSLQVTNHHKRPDGVCHQIVCAHTDSSLNGLEWTLCTDAPICGVSGDMHRIVVLCENSTAHVLDIKGRYAFPPMVLSGYPSKSVQSGPYLVVVTTKALIHMWNIHTKTVVIRSESLIPLLSQDNTEKERERVVDVARIQFAAGGLPIIVLNTGKSFMYSLDLCAWLLVSDPRGLVSSPLMPNPFEQSISTRMLFSDGRLRHKPEPAIVSHIKLKLASCTEMKNPEGIKQWLIALSKSLATHGLQKELHQLCEDLLGPTHSTARLTSKWNPTILGLVDKRKLLRQILTLLLEDLKYQEFYSEFDELLREVEAQAESETLPAITAPSTTPSNAGDINMKQT